jgi:hypothetical protein
MDGVIAVHELTHVEFHHRMGIRSAFIPAWFDEGLAVYVSGDRRYLAPESKGERCLADPSRPLPDSKPGWLRAAGDDTTLYAVAACRVSNWLTAKGGTAAVLTLSSDIRGGKSFADAYR